MKIQIKDLTKNFGRQMIFQQLNFDIEGRGIHGIMGSNGSGKTTLMRIIAGIDKQYRGQITVADSEGVPIGPRGCTYVSPYPYMLQGTVLENIAYPLKLRKWSDEAAMKRAYEMINDFDIGSLTDKKAAQLSAGETQKVALARALSFKPRVLLLDEPTSNIDRESIEVIEAVLKDHQVREDGLILAITHDLEQAKRMCQAVYILREGQLSRNL